ncbi:unnamed protein product [Sphagnum jensenii]|uniref:RING-CH-type domain-containing protein n=1 Tax=Sphagnum jensenii TaxID=128206 RepID=A0ABP0XC02_9BRYO
MDHQQEAPAATSSTSASSSVECVAVVNIPAAVGDQTLPAPTEPSLKKEPAAAVAEALSTALDISSFHDGTDQLSSSSSMHAGSITPQQQLVKSKSGKLSTRTGLVLPRPGLRSRATLDRNGSSLLTIQRTSGFIMPSSSSLMTPTTQSSMQSPLFSKRTISLPVTHHLEISSSSNSCSPAAASFQWPAPSMITSQSGGKSTSILRSISMPLRRGSSGTGGTTVLVRPATDGSSTTTKKEDCLTTQTADREISEEQAVCRICMDDLTEEYGETLKMECSCRGEMALAHRECALKWFSIKGNRTCDVCGREVSNLPVTVVRLPNESTGSSRVTGQQPVSQDLGRLWQDVPVLVMISMLAYFCFLEQLLVGKLGSGAIVIALPFSCILGFLAAIVASNFVAKQLIWLYATCQFGLIISFAHLFYDLVHVEAVLAIVLASFAGFGIAMTSSALIIEYANWKRRAATTPIEQTDATLVHEEESQQEVAQVQTNVAFSAPTEDHPQLRLLPHDIENPPVNQVQHPVPIEHSLSSQNLSHSATSYSEGLGIHHAFQGH